MDRYGSRTINCLPWDRTRERIVHFENSGPIAKSLEKLPVSRGETISGDLQQLPGSHVTERHSKVSQRCERVHPRGDCQLAAQALKVSTESIRDRLRPSPRNRPT